MNRLFLNTKITAVALVAILVISSFLTSCRKISGEMSLKAETNYVSQNETVGNTVSDESQSDTLNQSSTVQQNSSRTIKGQQIRYL